MNKICELCKNAFSAKRKTIRFCSIICSGKSRIKIRTKICKHCANEFSANNNERLFCSKKCSTMHNNISRTLSQESKERITKSLLRYYKENPNRTRIYKKREITIKQKECKECKTLFEPDKKYRKFCSTSCHIKSRAAKITNKISYRTFHKILKRAFKNWCCPFCSWNRSFEVHHIYGRTNNDFNCLVMLCHNHHNMADRKEISEEDLLKNAIGKSYSKEYLLQYFYNGKNTDVNFYKPKLSFEYRKAIKEQKKNVYFEKL